MFELINFKLPWLNEDGDEIENTSKKAESAQKLFELSSNRRQQKINRRNQFSLLEDTLANLKLEKQRNEDDDSLKVS